MVHVIAIIEVAKGRRDDFITIFRDVRPKVHAEDGCIEYGATIDAATQIEAQTLVGEDQVIVVEKWESPVALAAHLAAPHMDAFRNDVADMVTNLTIHVLSPVE